MDRCAQKVIGGVLEESGVVAVLQQIEHWCHAQTLLERWARDEIAELRFERFCAETDDAPYSQRCARTLRRASIEQQ